MSVCVCVCVWADRFCFLDKEAAANLSRQKQALLIIRHSGWNGVYVAGEEVRKAVFGYV
jgi:hypothetical protein